MLMKIFCRSLVILLCMFVTAGCADLFDPDADESSTAGGYLSVYDILAERGDYSLFLEAVDLTTFAKTMQGAGLVTVFAPGDDVFGPYIAGKYGVTDVSEIPEDDLTTLVGFHIVQYSYRPIDLLAFSMSGSAVVPEEGDGSCYKYLTMATTPTERMTNPYGYEFDVYSHNKYLPIMSTRFMESRGLADMQADYELLFPDVWWKGSDDQLYVGEAAVIESGITALNGYLYIIDNVAAPLNTIYDELNNDWAAEYSLFAELCQRVDYFEYSSDYTEVYADYGDSLFLHMTWATSVSGEDSDELAELGSEWTYHYSDVFDRAMKYTVHCFAPTNRYLETFLLEYFGDYFEDGNKDYVSQLPFNVIYHILRTFIFDKRELIFPSELADGLVGNNGEVWYLSDDVIQDVKMCSNGVIYGLDTILTNVVFNSVVEPIMTNPDYQYFANAITSDETYIMTASASNDYTFFVRSDDVIYSGSDSRFIDYEVDKIYPDYGTINFKYGATITAEDEADVSLMLKNNMVYGLVDGVTPVYNDGQVYGATPEGSERIRYYRTIGFSTSVRYFYTVDGDIYDQYDQVLNISNTYTGYNGTVYQVDREMVTEDEVSTVAQLLDLDANYSTFAALLMKVGIRSGSVLYDSSGSSITATMLFAPKEEYLAEAIRNGGVPAVSYVEGVDIIDSLVYSDSDHEFEELEDYLRYYFVSTVTNDLPTYLLPSLGSSGVTGDDDYSVRVISSIPYILETDIECLDISWSLEDPNVLTVTDNSNTSCRTSEETKLQFASDGVLYALEGAFDYNTMYEFK